MKERACVSIFLNGSVFIIHENFKRNREFHLKLEFNPTKKRVESKQGKVYH